MAELEDAVSSLKERAKKKLERDLGPLLISALADCKTVEVMLNADGRLWQERLGEKMRCIGTLSSARAEAIIKTVAGYHGKEVTRHKPVLEGELSLDGSRFAGHGICFTVRGHANIGRSIAIPTRACPLFDSCCCKI